MLSSLFKKLFKNSNERSLLKIKKILKIINEMESDIQKLNNTELSNKTIEFKKRIKNGETIDSLLPEAFAVVRESSKRIFNMRHFDVQIMGGIVLNNRCIAEMRTGEGKTLTSTLPAYLNALMGQGVHIVTVNDYLAKRDAENNMPLFKFLGMTVGTNISGLSCFQKRKAYQCDITYGTNNEYSFDYLKNNMIYDLNDKIQGKLYYALIDEVDSILIDEARTPLIISGPTENKTEMYHKINKLIPYFIRQYKDDNENFQGTGHYIVDEKYRQINLTERGLILIEKLLVKFNLMKEGDSLYSPDNIMLMHYVTAALRAHILFFCNIDYIVKDNEIVIVDEHTGRIMNGRRWSDGLHQAIEAKENIIIRGESQILASITFQNYFRLYEKLAGMTGTADTEAFEFREIYNLDTIVLPTNRKMIRKDLPDLVYLTEDDKINAIIKDIKKCIKCNRPVLVGTVSIEKSELISLKLKQEGIIHSVLNAKHHFMEAEIIAQAGKPGMVTIATNMAGRGTDIVLGGNNKSEDIKDNYYIYNKKIVNLNCIKKKKNNNWKQNNDVVLSAGGLHVIGTERHESRRIDNQLRGRSGRQGDPGTSRFYLSMEDHLMRIFFSERITNTMKKLSICPGEAIEHPWVTKAIAKAQYKLENHNFLLRKQLLEYDDIINDQRRIVYERRNEILESYDLSKNIKNIINNVFNMVIYRYIPLSINLEILFKEKIKNILELENYLKENFNLNINIMLWIKDIQVQNQDINFNKIFDYIVKNFMKYYHSQEQMFGCMIMRSLEKKIMLQTLDFLWIEHLESLEYLKQGIHLRGYAQKDPKQEYKKESFVMFTSMLESINYEVVVHLSHIDKIMLETYSL